MNAEGNLSAYGRHLVGSLHGAERLNAYRYRYLQSGIGRMCRSLHLDRRVAPTSIRALLPMAFCALLYRGALLVMLREQDTEFSRQTANLAAGGGANLSMVGTLICILPTVWKIRSVAR